MTFSGDFFDRAEDLRLARCMNIRALFPVLLAAILAPVLSASADIRVVLPDTVTPRHYDIAITPDADKLAFKGTVAIKLTVRAATNQIVLNAADIVIDRAALSGSTVTPTIAYDPKVETAAFSFPQALAPGDYVLTLDYHGQIYQQASGMFALDYDTPQGKKRSLFTQFENSDARRFVPCWDEPGIKAAFTLTATVPSGLMAVSNMPVAASDELPGGLKRVRFAESPKMSAYLLYFGLGDFERLHRMAEGVDVGVIVRRGDTAKGEYALGVACQILPYYNEYFGVPYPLPKLDLIAAPGQSQVFGAMENWGAIFYFERELLFDPKISTEREKQRIYTVVAHEMAHQWFGDLVTMAWWDDLWLNEGFASWMENKVTDHFHPEWNIWLQTLGTKQGAMQTDARDGTHAVITPINDVFQASGAFDNITYQKGRAVIRMLEAYIGEEAFRAGVRRYMANHAYGNTVTDDLWREIDAVSPRKLTDTAHDFTLQAGVPLITATPVDGGLRLTQSRFALDESGAAGGAWRVPAIVLPASGQELNAAKRTVVPGGPAVTVPEAPAGSIVNAGQSGYFRVRYEGAAFTAVSERYAGLSPDDQLGVLNDTATISYAGREPMADFLNITLKLPVEADPVVWSSLIGRFEGLDQIYTGLPGQGAFRTYVISVLEPVFRRTGWDARPGDSENTAILRAGLLGALGRFGDQAVVAEARRRFAGYLKDPASLTAAVRSTVLGIVAHNAGPADWEQLHTLARGAKTWLEKQEYYTLLGDATDPVLAQQALALALTEEPDPTLRPALVDAVSGEHPETAFDFAVAHWAVFGKLIEPGSQQRYVPGLLGSATDTRVLDKLNAFVAAHIAAGADQDARKVAATIRYVAGIRLNRLPEVDRWLADRAKAPGK